MHRSPTSLLKRSPVMARSMVMPSLVLPTSTSIEGRYLFTEFDQFSGLPTIPRQPIQRSWIEHPDRWIHVSPDTHYEPARKKRLTIGQIKALECSFAVDNKLEPERKNMLARELGLQPRQVAIWYQNRRARTKSKNLEEKYDALHMQYQGVLNANKKLEAEVIKLRKLLGLQEQVKLGANDDKTVVDKRQENNSALSTNREEAHFSRMEGWQQQIYIEGKSNEQTVDSEYINSCATAQNESTLNANSPPSTCTFNLANDTIDTHISQTQGVPLYAQQKEMCHFNHQVIANTIDDNQLHHHHHHQQQQLQQHQGITYTDDDNKLQQHHHQQQLPELLQHFQHHYYLSGCNNSVEDAKLDDFESIVLPSTSHAHFDGQFLDDYETASSILSLLLKPRESLTLLP